jgi:hypothetical protein
MAGKDEGAAIHVGYDSEGIFSHKSLSCRLNRHLRRSAEAASSEQSRRRLIL